MLDTILQDHLAAAGRSKYPALVAGLRQAVAQGVLDAGDRLSPVRDLAYRLGVTPGTVARAYAVLTDEGVLRGEVGRGTFVARAAPVSERPPARRAQFPDIGHDMSQVGHFVSPRLPDLGQGALIRDGLVHVGTALGEDGLLRYPSTDTGEPARAAFRDQCAERALGPLDVGDVFLGHGGQNAIVLILQTVLRGPAPVVAVETLSYGGFRSAAALCRAEVVGIEGDADGPLPDAFEAAIRARGIQVFLTSSEVNNPTLTCTGMARREAIAAIAARHGVHIVDDDCYSLTERAGPSYRALLPDLGWVVASPSKSLSAALRIGFGVAPRLWAARAARTATCSSFGVSRIVTDLYAWMMAQPQMTGIRRAIIDRVAQDVRTAVNALGGYKIVWRDGVPLVWLELPDGWRAGEFGEAAREAGVLLKTAEDFALRDSRRVHAVRIAMNGQVGAADFAAAMGRLRALLDAPPERITT